MSWFHVKIERTESNHIKLNELLNKICGRYQYHSNWSKTFFIELNDTYPHFSKVYDSKYPFGSDAHFYEVDVDQLKTLMQPDNKVINNYNLY